jgi:nicotinate-nucleotide pyrophosphorylase (carboxylating)
MSHKDFRQIEWDADTADDCRCLVGLAVREDLGRFFDWTTVSLVSSEARGTAWIAARESGIVCGMKAMEVVLDEMQCQIDMESMALDGDPIETGAHLARLTGSVRDLLAAERILLNFAGHLSGIATLTRQYVNLVAETSARIYDTRKTIPAYRRLEKYAARCGGARNHRLGLHEAILIKDNHLAFGREAESRFSAAEAIHRCRKFLANTLPAEQVQSMLVEIEVDTLDQLRQVLPADPDIVLLDNMRPQQLREAVEMRNQWNSTVELEASGGVNLQTVRSIAETGIDRISVGALTHSARCLDIGLDWNET